MKIVDLSYDDTVSAISRNIVRTKGLDNQNKETEWVGFILNIDYAKHKPFFLLVTYFPLIDLSYRQIKLAKSKK